MVGVRPKADIRVARINAGQLPLNVGAQPTKSVQWARAGCIDRVGELLDVTVNFEALKDPRSRHVNNPPTCVESIAPNVGYSWDGFE